jgi:DNA-binding winged helix-turn-helix (wHTH) protein
VKNTLPDRVRLGVFDVDLRTGELWEGDRCVILQDQSLRILCMLVDCDGGLVSREEIRNNLWPNDTVVEFDHSINAAIKKLRQALGDSPDDPKYIETIRGKGYRLLVPVERVAASRLAVQISGANTPSVFILYHDPWLVRLHAAATINYHLLNNIGLAQPPAAVSISITSPSIRSLLLR